MLVSSLVNKQHGFVCVSVAVRQEQNTRAPTNTKYTLRIAHTTVFGQNEPQTCE